MKPTDRWWLYPPGHEKKRCRSGIASVYLSVSKAHRIADMTYSPEEAGVYVEIVI
ncbi:hypothetical protein ACFL9T_16510 [Thermodesulfobacteriota bacterium]